MAEANSTFIPREIPLRDTDGVSWAGYGWRTYTIGTDCGKLAVAELRHCRTISGSAAALASYGLLKEEWLPGIPGNNATRQTVVFAPSGTWLIHGNRGSSKLPYPYLVIIRTSSKEYVVEQNYTDEERSIIEAFYDEQWARNRIEAREKAGAEAGKVPPAGGANTALEWKRARLAELDIALRRLAGDEESAGAGGGKFAFSDSTQRQILACIETLRSAVLGGGVVCRQRRREGNVVYLQAAPPEEADVQKR